MGGRGADSDSGLAGYHCPIADDADIDSEPALLNLLESGGTLPPPLVELPIDQWSVLPHLSWLTVMIVACMILYVWPNGSTVSD